MKASEVEDSEGNYYLFLSHSALHESQQLEIRKQKRA